MKQVKYIVHTNEYYSYDDMFSTSEKFKTREEAKRRFDALVREHKEMPTSIVSYTLQKVEGFKTTVLETYQ